MNVFRWLLTSRVYTVSVCSSVIWVMSILFGLKVLDNERTSKDEFYSWDGIYAAGVLISAIHRVVNFEISYQRARKRLSVVMILVSVIMVVGDFFEARPIIVTARFTLGALLGEAGVMAWLLLAGTARSGGIVFSFILSGLHLDQGCLIGVLFGYYVAGRLLELPVVVVGLATGVGAWFIRNDADYAEKPKDHGIYVGDELRPWLRSVFQSLTETRHIYRDLAWFSYIAYKSCRVTSTLSHGAIPTLNKLRDAYNPMQYFDPEYQFEDIEVEPDQPGLDTTIDELVLAMALLILPIFGHILAGLWTRVFGLKMHTVCFSAFLSLWLYELLSGDEDRFTQWITWPITVIFFSFTPALANLTNNVRSKHLAVQCQLYAVLIALLALGPVITVTVGQPDDLFGFVVNAGIGLLSWANDRNLHKPIHHFIPGL